MSEVLTIRLNGDCSLLIDVHAEFFSADVCLSSLTHALAENLRQSNISDLLEVVPTTAAVMLVFDRPISLDEQRCQSIMSWLRAQLMDAQLQPVVARQLSIPVCYERPHCVDLMQIADRTQLSSDEIIALHQATVFRVDMLGFLPGFAYLRGLPEQLQLPRKANPVLHVDKGSIAIASEYCGLYPQDSPGGWYVIGRTPWRLFDHRKAQPARLLPGDQIQFTAIDAHQFDVLFKAEYADVIDDC